MIDHKICSKCSVRCSLQYNSIPPAEWICPVKMGIGSVTVNDSPPSRCPHLFEQGVAAGKSQNVK